MNKNELLAGTKVEQCIADDSIPSASLVQNGMLAESVHIKPIPFSTPMIQAILEGRKTQTRRIIKNVPKGLTEVDTWIELISRENPYGHELLWVREKWRKNDTQTVCPFHYYADDDTYTDKDNERWKPSIHMPKKAARIFLKINSITVQKLHDITEKDAIAEGISFNSNSIQSGYGVSGSTTHVSAVSAFKALWQKINGENSWDANPWVWVVGFEMVEAPSVFC